MLQSSLRMTAQDLVGLGIVDEVIPEPLGGAHQSRRAMCDRVAKALTNQLYALAELPSDQLIAQRDRSFARSVSSVDSYRSRRNRSPPSCSRNSSSANCLFLSLHLCSTLQDATRVSLIS